MSLSSYVEACKQFEWELKGSLTTEEINELRKDCAALGHDGWEAWEAANYHIIVEFVAAAPSSRTKKKSWKDPVLKRRLVLGAIYHVQRACHLLTGIHENFLEPGPSYRDMAAKAGRVYLEIFGAIIPDWPFDEPNPFETDY
ncbi:MAG: hypothetical protein AB1847_18390 [bacterium]